MSTKRSRRNTAYATARAESDRRYPNDVKNGRSLRVGFIAGAMWHRELSWPAAGEIQEDDDVPDL